MSMNIAPRFTGQRFAPPPTKIQRNGNVQTSLQVNVPKLEKLIEAAKQLYVLRYRKSNQTSILEAFARLNKLIPPDHELSENARQYINCALGDIVPGSNPPEIMWDAFN
jgi:hypothetical protein